MASEETDEQLIRIREKIDKFQYICEYENPKAIIEFAKTLTREEVRADDVYAFAVACSTGNLDIAKWMMDYFEITPTEICADREAFRQYLRDASRNNYLNIAQWLDEIIGFTIDDAQEDGRNEFGLGILAMTCNGGHLEMAKWLIDRFGLAQEDNRIEFSLALRFACGNGHLAVAQFLTERFVFTKEDIIRGNNRTLGAACSHNHMDAVQWTIEHFGFTPDDIRLGNNHLLEQACVNGRLDIVQYLIKKGITKVDLRTSSGHMLEMLLKDMHKDPRKNTLIMFYSIDDKDAIEKFRAGQLETAQWLVDHFELTPSDAGEDAAVLDFPGFDIGPKSAAKLL